MTYDAFKHGPHNQPIEANIPDDVRVGIILCGGESQLVGIQLGQNPQVMTPTEARQIAASLLDVADQLDDEGEN